MVALERGIEVNEVDRLVLQVVAEDIEVIAVVGEVADH
jgi:hypothetical protein